MAYCAANIPSNCVISKLVDYLSLSSLTLTSNFLLLIILLHLNKNEYQQKDLQNRQIRQPTPHAS